MKEFILPYWRKLSLILILGTVATLSGLAQPYFTKVLIDDALLGRNASLLLWISLAMLGVTTLSYALNAWTGYRYLHLSAGILFDMRRAVYQHLQKLSPRFYAKSRLGEIVSRLNNDVGEIQRISADTFLALTTNILFLIGTVAILLYLNPALFALTFILLPFTIYGLVRARKRLEAATEAVRQRSSDLGSFLIETLMGMRTVVLMTKEQHEVERFRERNDGFVRALLRYQLTSIVAGMIPSAGLTVGTLLVFMVGGYQVISSTMSLGAFVAFMAYQARVIAPIQNIMTLYGNLATLKISVKRVMELFDAKPDVVDGTEALPPGDGEIEFRNVDFRHDREEILAGASFTIPAGAFCVILGPSGAGKSSIADLLVRLYDTDSGTVLLDGRDIRTYRLAGLRHALALVEQDTFLFNATIEENVRYGGDDYVHTAWFPHIPASTKVGDRGLALSGGEKQRIGVARALSRNPKVLILDEATSAMDVDLERTVLLGLRERMKGRTIILITHRSYLANDGDIVLQVEGGKVTVVEHAQSCNS